MTQKIKAVRDHTHNYKYMMNIMEISDNTREMTSNLPKKEQ
jgi:hypothetical protein